MKRLSVAVKVSIFLPVLVGVSGWALASTSGSVNTDVAVTVGAYDSTLQAALRPAFYRALAQDAGAVYAVNKKGCVSLSRQKLEACFDSHGAHFSGSVKPLSLNLVAFGRVHALSRVETVQPSVKNNWVSYGHAGLTEWWRILPGGIEQGFSIAERPAGRGKLILELSSNDRAVQQQDTLTWGRLRYGQLVVTDARGRIVPSLFSTQGKLIQIVVYDAHAVYPLTVDPLIWIEQKIVSSDGIPYGLFGFSAAVSGDTAIVGGATSVLVDGSTTPTGAAYVFTRSGGKWSLAQELTADGGLPGDQFGDFVTLDGDTAFVGAQFAPFDSNKGPPGPGAVYVFTKAKGSWTQTQILTADDGAPFDLFGHTIAASGDTVFIGAQFANVGTGAVYVFVKSKNGWIQTQKLTPSSGTQGTFGASIAFDGTTALVGVPVGACIGTGCPPVPAGSGLIYTNDKGTWTQTQELTVAENECNNNFATAVAIEGGTALIGCGQFLAGPDDEDSAVVFTSSGGTWSETQRLIPSDGGPGIQNFFGEFLVFSGQTALVGAPDANVGENFQQGAAYLFTETGGVWNQTAKLVASDGSINDKFGTSGVALDAETALVGVPYAIVGSNPQQGVAYFYSVSDLGLTVNTPATVEPGQNYTSQIIATNNASVASPAVSAVIPVPSAASYVSATSTQGTCDYESGTVTCALGSIEGNAGTATASVKLKNVHIVPGTIENIASIAKATPALTASASTTIVGSDNDPPVANDGSLSVEKNKSASGTLSATDPDGDPLTFSIVVQPPNGKVTLTDAATGSYTYTPNQGFSGNDSFAFTASDGQATSNVATVNVTVKAASSGSGGGGSLGWLILAMLTGLALVGAVVARGRKG